MATVTSTVTVDTGEWIYVDVTGMTHTVTNAQTFTLTIDDNSSSDDRYYLVVGQTPITCTDGSSLTFRPETAMASGTSGNEYRMVAPLTDAGEGSDFYSLRGELCIQCPVSGVVQRWRVAKMNPSNADFSAAGTLIMTLEDQFGHTMVVPFTGSGLTVGQAA
jgi:hypothetical protein